MKLYEINAELEALLEQVDPETGELTCNMDALEALTMARDEKLEGMALYVKNMDAEAAAIKAEEKALADRRKALENKAERTRVFLQEALSGETIKTARVVVSYRRSEAVEIRDPDFILYADPKFLTQKNPDINKFAIKAAIKAGEIVPGAELVTRQNMSIK